MLLHELTIDRPTSYGNDPLKPLQGKVVLKGQQGTVEINLSPIAIGGILNLIAVEAGLSAKSVAKQVETAVASASNEHLLIGKVGD